MGLGSTTVGPSLALQLDETRMRCCVCRGIQLIKISKLRTAYRKLALNVALNQMINMYHPNKNVNIQKLQNFSRRLHILIASYLTQRKEDSMTMQAMSGTVTVRPLPIGISVSGKVEKQCAHFFGVTINEQQAEAGIGVRFTSYAQSKFKLAFKSMTYQLLYFEQDANGGYGFSLQILLDYYMLIAEALSLSCSSTPVDCTVLIVSHLYLGIFAYIHGIRMLYFPSLYLSLLHIHMQVYNISGLMLGFYNFKLLDTLQ